MQAKPFTFVQCWKQERISQVINKEATSVDTATFLATHTPLSNLTYHRTPQVVSDPGENGLLQELRRCAEKDMHAFVVVQGIPGTGKSHLIRWLKERYAAEADQRHERILFIERAQCSLRNTLEQIIQSGVFDKETMKEQLERLNGARIELSREALSSTLLDQLRVAIGEVQQVAMPDWLAKRNRLEKYLLDFVVRQELTKAGGPIDRVVRFLRSGSGIQHREMPNFEENDFVFHPALLRQIEGYAEAKYVAERLQDKERVEERHALATYLNRLLPFAIGHATALTNDDFKQIFYDLRRHLRRQNQSLTLFIEDITALTGIDTGLLDVLATQHVGEGSQEFCRIASVVGITDSYFTDSFPDNMKDRVTHRLSLNAMHSNLSDAELLVDANGTASLAARYLNVMRLEQQTLDEWLRQGARPSQLPNACTNCLFKTACHAAFGACTILSDDGGEQSIGLYPFNRKAIWTLYQFIDTSSSRRTPRSLLHNVLHYILQSHGSKVRQGDFPPASAELGNEFITFSLNNPLQRSIITAQGGSDARRIETLVIVWGDGTVDAQPGTGGTGTLVGGLPPEVFQAFGIRPIAGESIPVPLPSASSRRNITGSPPPAAPDTRIYQEEAGRVTEKNFSASSQPAAGLQSRYVQDITNWSNGGKLVYYAEYREWLVPLLRSFIDWDFYHISNRQLDEALKEKRIYIERQEGKMNVAHYLTLKCEPEFVDVLQALVQIRERGQALKDAVLSSCLSSFSIWLHKHEAEIVQFVQQPHQAVSGLLPLDEMLFFTCLVMACLQGALQRSYQSTQDLWLDLVRFCVDTRNSSAAWEQFQQKVEQQHSRTWASLVKYITPKRASDLCSLLLSVLNCSQGESSEVRFLDASAALNLLKQLQENNWQLPETPLLDAAVIPWGDVVHTYATLQKQFAAALNDDCRVIQDLLARLSDFTANHPPKEVFCAIQTFTKVMGEVQIPTKFVLKREMGAEQFINLQAGLQSILHEERLEQRAFLLSNAGEWYRQAQAYLTYFEDFVKEATKLKETNEKRLAQLQSQIAPQNLSKQEEVQALYREIADTFDVQLVKGGKV